MPKKKKDKEIELERTRLKLRIEIAKLDKYIWVGTIFLISFLGAMLALYKEVGLGEKIFVSIVVIFVFLLVVYFVIKEHNNLKEKYVDKPLDELTKQW